MNPPKKILIVDDEMGMRCLLSEVLSGEGFDVSLAKDGLESIDKLGNEQFELVITDLHMPQLDGFQVVNWMRKEGRREKVILMTADSSDRRLADADVPPVVSRLEKPFQMDGFLRLVTAAMNVNDAAPDLQLARDL